MQKVDSLRLRDGRRLVWEEAGAPAGSPVLFFHGTPGCRLQRRVFIDDQVLVDAGVRMITPDRPGCGGCDFQPGRRLMDTAADTSALLDALAITSVRVLAFSGGTPYALLLAAASNAVSGLWVVSGDAPPGRVPGVQPGLPLSAVRSPALTSATLRLVALLARFAPGVTTNTTARG